MNGVNEMNEMNIEEIKSKAEAGDADAQFKLGGLYHFGQGVPEDVEEAAKWYRQAAEQGFAEAQYILGFMYFYARGVPEDGEEAMKWFRKAADQGNARAQCHIGEMYHCGRFVPQDYKEAVKWYLKAAEQGFAEAQFNLGWMYRDGAGVPQDDEKAKYWLDKYRYGRNRMNAKNKCYMAYVPGYEDEGYTIGYFYAASEEDALKMAVKEEPSDVEIYIDRCEGLDNMQGEFSYGKNPHFVDVWDKGNVKVLKELGYILERKDGDYTCYSKKEDCEWDKQIMMEDEDEEEEH